MSVVVYIEDTIVVSFNTLKGDCDKILRKKF